MTDDTRRSDAIWELLGDHLVELIEARRKLKALEEYRDSVDAMIGPVTHLYRADDLAHKLSEILNGTGL